MDLATIIGVLAGLGLIFGAITVGGSIGGFVDVPGLLIVGGGTMSAMLVCFPFGTVKNSVMIAMKAIRTKPHNPVRAIKQMVEISKKVRKEGPLYFTDVQESRPFSI